jgi:hypothetical protein
VAGRVSERCCLALYGMKVAVVVIAKICIPAEAKKLNCVLTNGYIVFVAFILPESRSSYSGQ